MKNMILLLIFSDIVTGCNYHSGNASIIQNGLILDLNCHVNKSSNL